MPKGDNLKGGEISKATQFSAERQPENRKQPQVNIVEAVRKLMEGEGWAVVEAELLDEDDKPTGKKAKVRFKTPTVEAAAQAWASKVSKADPKLLEMYLDRTLGKVPTNIDLGLQKDVEKLLPKIEISFRPPTDDAPPESEQKAEKPKE